LENEHRGRKKTSNGKEGEIEPSKDLGKEEEAVHQ
jgi:hypothetical protein